MPNFSPLDMPLNEGRVVIRQPHSTFFEIIIGGANIAFLLLFTAIAIWSILENGFSLFLFVPYVFVLIIAIVISIFLWNWRRASLDYEQTGDIKTLENSSIDFPIFMAGISLFFWGIYVLFVGYNLFFGEVHSWPVLIRYILLLLPGIILGPLQFIYLKQLNKLKRFAVNYHQLNP